MKRITQGIKSVNTKKQKTNYKTKSKTRTKEPSSYYVVKSLNYPFPRIYQCDMRYDNIKASSMIGGAYATYKLSCNGLYDPDISGVGLQPLYFTTLSSLYDHYTVISSEITIEPCSAAVDANMITALFKDDDTTVPATIAVAMSRPGAVSRAYNPSVSKCPPLRIRWSAASEFSNTTPWTDPELQGTSTTNPTEQTYYIIASTDSLSNTFVLTYNISIRYTVRWDELKTVST